MVFRLCLTSTGWQAGLQLAIGLAHPVYFHSDKAVDKMDSDDLCPNAPTRYPVLSTTSQNRPQSVDKMKPRLRLVTSHVTRLSQAVGKVGEAG
jgi:hypothetical protein